MNTNSKNKKLEEAIIETWAQSITNLFVISNLKNQLAVAVSILHDITSLHRKIESNYHQKQNSAHSSDCDQTRPDSNQLSRFMECPIRNLGIIIQTHTVKASQISPKQP